MKQLGKLLYLILGALLMWGLSRYLTDVAFFGGKAIGEIAQFMVPHDWAEQDAIYYVEFIIWLGIFWVSQGQLGTFFGWLIPKASRYSETRPHRLAQAFGFEIFIFGSCACVIAALLLLIPDLRKEPMYKTMESFGFMRSEMIEVEPDQALFPGEKEECLYLTEHLYPNFELGNEDGTVATFGLVKTYTHILFRRFYFGNASEEEVIELLREIYRTTDYLEDDEEDDPVLYYGYDLVPYTRELMLLELKEELFPSGSIAALSKEEGPITGPYYNASLKEIYYKVSGVGAVRFEYTGIEPPYRTLTGQPEDAALPMGTTQSGSGYQYPRGNELTYHLLSGSQFFHDKSQQLFGFSNAGEEWARSSNVILNQLRPSFEAYIKVYEQGLPANYLQWRTLNHPDSIDAKMKELGSEVIQYMNGKQHAKVWFVLWKHSFSSNFWFIFFLTLWLGLAISCGIKRYVYAFYAPVLRFLDKGRMGVGGAARFAGLIEEWKFLKSRQHYGIQLGRSQFNPFVDLACADNKHMLTFAATRAGKGTACIIPNLLSWPGNCVVIDPKGGENAAITARRRREMGQKVYIINPFNEFTDILGETDSFNPFARLDIQSDQLHPRTGLAGRCPRHAQLRPQGRQPLG